MFPPTSDDSSPSTSRSESDDGKKRPRLIRPRRSSAGAGKAEKAAKVRSRRVPRGGKETASVVTSPVAAEASSPVGVAPAAFVAPAMPAAEPAAPPPAVQPEAKAPPPPPASTETIPPPAPEPAPSLPPRVDTEVKPAAEPLVAPASPAPLGHSRGGQGDAESNMGGGGGPQGGGDRGDRGFWKHGKRKRGRHGGGHWQPGGPGQGGREQFPPQLPPPSNAPVFGDLPNPSRFADLAALDALAVQLSDGAGDPIWLHEVYALSLAELTDYVRRLGLAVEGSPGRRQLIVEMLRHAATGRRLLRDRGYIDQNDRGAFVVHPHVNYRLFPEDPYLPDSLIKRYGLKRGHQVEVTLQPPLEGERCPSVIRIDRVMGSDPAEVARTTPFEELIPYYPLKRILLEDPNVVKDVSMRAVDILTPIGFGQRGLIVAPPRTGKTILLQNIANSISANSPEVKLILLLIDERPEEVTDFRRHTKGEVVSSTFDETPESHVHCAEMVIEICRRRVEMGEHVVILLDSITRLARAYNALAGNQGKTMSGGLESNALQKPKRFFGSARNIEGGGSLTIIASALIDTGSRMDEIIFEEFKGTGNSELHLDRGLVERRIFPAINIDRSGTRKEELIYHPEELQRIYGLRRAMQGLGPIESMEMLITRLKKTKSNAEFLLSLAPK